MTMRLPSVGIFLLVSLAAVAVLAHADPNVVKRPTSDNGAWQITRSTSKMDDSKVVILSVGALDEVSGWLRTYKPTLVIMCNEHKTNIYVDMEMPSQPELGEYQRHSVQIRLDNHKMFTEHWSESTDSNSLFAPDPMRLAGQLVHAEVMYFRFTPFNSNPQLTEFPLHGLTNLLTEVANACSWEESKRRTARAAYVAKRDAELRRQATLEHDRKINEANKRFDECNQRAQGNGNAAVQCTEQFVKDMREAGVSN